MSNKEKWKILCEDLMTQSIAKEKDLKSKNWKILRTRKILIRYKDFEI